MADFTDGGWSLVPAILRSQRPRRVADRALRGEGRHSTPAVTVIDISSAHIERSDANALVRKVAATERAAPVECKPRKPPSREPGAAQG